MSKEFFSNEKKIHLYILLFSLSQFLFNSPEDEDTDGYLYEAKCQLLMYSAIAIIKMNTIVGNDVSFYMEFSFSEILETSIDT